MKVFPSLKTRPLYLTGESYAGVYIVRPAPLAHQSRTVLHAYSMLSMQPYITKAYFGVANPPVNLVKISMGNAVFGDVYQYEIMPTVSSPQRFFAGVR